MQNSIQIKNTHHFTHVAMATLFDLIIVHENKDYAQQAAWEAIKEIDRLENELSRFKPNSDISRINNLKIGERIVLGIDAFNCINRSIELHKATNGAFNIACGSLLKCWLNLDYTLRNPSNDEIESAIKKSKIENIFLHSEDFSIEIIEEGTILDLGAFGKGFAIDIVAQIFNEWQIENALLSSGRSSIKAIGHPPDLPGWQISVSIPAKQNEVLKTFYLNNISVGASGISKGHHIINTVSGMPVEKKVGSWVFSESTADADAFSTAFMILGNDSIQQTISMNSNISCLVIEMKENLQAVVANEFGKLPLTV
ncbi:MAG: FAD:protein FMN transferase [Ignavibacteria bacterium]|nr:FAD:protein FMN transferase [Ignavibacteria bacterium]